VFWPALTVSRLTGVQIASNPSEGSSGSASPGAPSPWRRCAASALSLIVIAWNSRPEAVRWQITTVPAALEATKDPVFKLTVLPA
jgi:hypothetical protein